MRLLIHDYAGHPIQVPSSRELARLSSRVPAAACRRNPNRVASCEDFTLKLFYHHELQDG
jgi:hypothetical protein